MIPEFLKYSTKVSKDQLSDSFIGLLCTFWSLEALVSIYCGCPTLPVVPLPPIVKVLLYYIFQQFKGTIYSNILS